MLHHLLTSKHPLSPSKILSVFALLFFLNPLFAQTLRYVTPTGSGTMDGSSWANASPDLQLIINNSIYGDSIFVAKGLYNPQRPINDLNTLSPNNRNNSFLMKNGVAVYGGFDPQNGIVDLGDTRIFGVAGSHLSSDFNDDDVINTAPTGVSISSNTENAYHVVIFLDCYPTTVLDGFTIRGGNANGSGSTSTSTYSVPQTSGAGVYLRQSSPQCSNLTIQGNFSSSGGGGMHNIGYSSPRINNVHFYYNRSLSNGGALVCQNQSNPLVTNSIFSGNSSLFGAAIYNVTTSKPSFVNCIVSGNVSSFGIVFNSDSSTPLFTNCTFSGNNGQLVYDYSANNSTQIRNSILYNNAGPYHYPDTLASLNISYSLLDSSFSGIGNIMDNPLFTGAINPSSAPFVNGDYHLQNCSPAFNRGNSDVYLSGQLPDISSITTDFENNPRIIDGLVDMGPYESQTLLPSHQQTESGCISYTWTNGNGQTYTTSTTAYHLVSGVAPGGCDSLYVLNLTLNEPIYSTDNQISCSGITWIDGTYYTESVVGPTFTLASSAGCDSIVTLNLTIFEVDQSVTQNGNTLSANLSGVSYQWLDCENNYAPVENAGGQTFTANTNGSYAVEVNDGNCVDTSACFTVSGMGIAGDNATLKIELYPNPSHTYVYVQGTQPGTRFRLFDLSGKIVFEGRTNETNTRIETAAYNPGVYTIHIGEANHTIRKVLIIN